MLLHDALFLPFLGLLTQTLLLGLADLLQLGFTLLQLFLLALNIEALQAFLALLDGLSPGQDALMIFAGIFEIGGDGLLTMIFTFLLWMDKKNVIKT